MLLQGLLSLFLPHTQLFTVTSSHRDCRIAITSAIQIGNSKAAASCKVQVDAIVKSEAPLATTKLALFSVAKPVSSNKIREKQEPVRERERK